jgi:hypothetical protein
MVVSDFNTQSVCRFHGLSGVTIECGVETGQPCGPVSSVAEARSDRGPARKGGGCGLLDADAHRRRAQEGVVVASTCSLTGRFA